MKKVIVAIASLSISVCAAAQTAEGSITSFRRPAAEIEQITMAPPVPSVSFCGDMTKAVISSTDCRSIPVAELAANEIRIAGLRLNPENFSQTRESYNRSLELLNPATGATVKVEGIPANAKIRHLSWSPSGKYFCFTNTTDKSVDLYRVDATASSPKAEKISNTRLNSTFGSPYMFLDDETILYKAVPASRVKTPEQKVAQASVIQENLGVKKSIRTYEDLLSGPFDEQLFDYCCTSILTVFSPAGTRQFGGEAIYRSLEPSPDGTYLMTTTEHRPYSYIETHRSFTSKQFIMDLQGNVVKMIKDGTVKEEKPAPGDTTKPKAPRAPQPSGFTWRSDMPATLVWTETKPGARNGFGAPAPQDAAKDGKDAKKEKKPEATHTQLMYQCGAPFNYETDKTVVLAPEFSMGRVTWGNEGFAIYTETSRDQKIRKTMTFVPGDTLAKKNVILVESTERDSLGTFPVYGSPYTVRNKYGRSVVWTDAKKSYIYMSGSSRRDSEGWPVSFMDKLTIKDGKISNVWTEDNAGQKETLVGVSDFSKLKLVFTRESFNVVPDYYEKDVRKGSVRQITHLPNPVSQLSDLITKTNVKYTRKDGLQCYGNLYLPKGYDKERDGRLPVLMWTYPYEYNSAVACDKSRAERYKYLKPSYGSAQIWATQGYAVLDDFTMAIVSHHPDSLPNDVFLEQLIMSAEAAVDFVTDTLGIADRDRIAVGGHSYGGFMTANLLAHTKLFRAGIARSGAYMRSLTPFGFQSERRDFWKGKEVYDEMSPFNYADKLKDAILIIHGQLDDNMGTFPVQSERLYQALVYNGGTARYVQLPYEAHSYLGKETTLDMLYETGAWLDKYVKNAKPREVKKEDKKEEKKAE